MICFYRSLDQDNQHSLKKNNVKQIQCAKKRIILLYGHLRLSDGLTYLPDNKYYAQMFLSTLLKI